MLRFFYIAFIVLVCERPCVYSQSSVEIFADTQTNDSLAKLISLFTGQLKKALPADYIVKPVSSYTDRGIRVGLSGTYTGNAKTVAKLKSAGVEAFAIDADERNVQILGNSNAALSHGVFSYLHAIGFRFYFPNKDWHIIPAAPRLFQKISMVSGPSFYHRRIWYGYGTGSKIADADYWFWVQANKLGGSINAYFGHAYGNIIAQNREEFEKHPEWLYPRQTKGTAYTGDEKFDVSNEELVQFLIRDAERQIEQSLKNKTEQYKMISLAPSDGPGTCNSPACQRLGTITDRVIYPVNRVARAIRKKYPSTLIGCLAYGEYIAPPTVKVEPNVFIAITTAFNSTQYSTNQLVDFWRKKGAVIGIYDYFSWFAWDQDLPGQSLASRSTEIVNTIRRYEALGVKAYEGESSQGWISKGLGYYLAAMTMWNSQANIQAARAEFFKLCFGNAASIMEKLWNEWDVYPFKMIREADLAKWIDYTVEAGRMEKNENVRKRLFQIRSYLHYLALYRLYYLDKSEPALLSLLTYGYRKLDDGSVAGFPAFYELGNRSGLPGMAYGENARWKSNAGTVKEEELNRLMAEDRRNLKINEQVKIFPVAEKLGTVPDLKKYSAMMQGINKWGENAWWFDNEWVIQIKKKGTENFIEFTASLFGNINDVRLVKISVYSYRPDGNIKDQPVLVSREYTGKTAREKVSLAGLNAGYYTVVVQDPAKGYLIGYSPSINFSQVVRPSRNIKSTALMSAFIYVPEGVRYFNLMRSKIVEFATPTGRKISFPDDRPEDVQIEVMKGEAGLWRVKLYDEVYFEGIPPFISTSPAQMLVPAIKN